VQQSTIEAVLDDYVGGFVREEVPELVERALCFYLRGSH